MEYKMAYMCDQGKIKEKNQDSFCYFTAQISEGKIMFAAVCDGMGGLEKGELASASIIRMLSSWFENDLKTIIYKNHFKHALFTTWSELIDGINTLLITYGKKNKLRLGTTLSMVLCMPDGRYYIGHVGDTRIYRLDDYGIKQITSDQTFIANEIKHGRITFEEAREDPRNHVLLQCIGVNVFVQPQFLSGIINAGEYYLLCSDGFRNKISEDEMFTTLRAKENNNEIDLKKILSILVSLNRKRKEEDNITALLIGIGEEFGSNRTDY